MSEHLSKARNRLKQRLPESILDPVEIRSLTDIKRILSEFDPAKNSAQKSIPIKADLQDDKKYAVTADTTSRSKRDMLLEGFEIMKRQIKSQNKDDVVPVSVDGIDMLPANTGNAENAMSWIDPLIKQWMGATREGMFICWDIDGEHYKYDIYTHKLTKVVI
jgi:hypothetical protein